MNYQESINYLEGLGKFGIRLGMERIEALLRELGNPERQVKTVHVTGTNGKGSVTSMIANIFLAAGLHVGKFTSPHLVKYNERINVDGKDISDDDFAVAIAMARQAADTVVSKGICEQPTQFELLTAAAFWHFACLKLDYAVIEVGLGGLWDSTNVITPLVSVITNVQMDHTDRCGATLDRIAMQKAGIIKEKVPLVTAAEGDEALGPIVTMALFRQAPCYLYGKAFWGTELESSLDGQQFTLYAGNNYHAVYAIKLLGEHQIKNAAVAIVAAKLVAKEDSRISETALHLGAAQTVWPGRLERIATSPDIILDGAHNPDGAKALRAALNKYYPSQPVHFVFGMMGDKDMSGVITALLTPRDTVYTVRADSGKRAAEASTLAEMIGLRATACADLRAAYQSALSSAGKEGIVCVCGSLYLVGEFKKMQL